MASTNIYHWIGATADSVSKYDWNVTNNWLVENTVADDSTTSVSYTKYTRATRYPISGDTVKIGSLFHCLSPILFGGYVGGMTHSAANGWGDGTTSGITGGGVELIIHTDVAATNSPASFNNLYSLLKNEDGSFYYTANAGGPWGASGSFSQNMTDYNLVQALLTVNPHMPVGTYNRLPTIDASGNYATGTSAMYVNYTIDATAGSAYSANDMAFYGAYDAMCQNYPCPPHVVGEYGMTPAKYPFPYLGGGLTGDILKWATTQYARSFYGYASAGSGGGLTTAAGRNEQTTAAARRNAWVGGGISGLTAGGATAAAVARASENSLRVRHTNLHALSSSSPLNNPLFVDLDLVQDKGEDGTISSTVKIDQNLCTNHAFRLEGGIVRELDLIGDASVWAVGTTAASINSDVSTYLRTDTTLRCGGVRIRWVDGSDRFNEYSGYFLGGITAGARTAVYGTNDDTMVRDSNANKLILEPVGERIEPNGATQIEPYSANAMMSGIVAGDEMLSRAYQDPRFSIGLINGTTAGTVVIPTLESSSEYTKQWQIHMSGPVSINTIDDTGSNVVLASPLAGVNNRVIVGNLFAQKGTIVDFRSNPKIDDIILGTVGGTSAGQTSCALSAVRLAGGLQCKDDSVTILASAGQVMVNTKYVAGKDVRASIAANTRTIAAVAANRSAVANTPGLLTTSDAISLNAQ